MKPLLPHSGSISTYTTLSRMPYTSVKLDKAGKTPTSDVNHVFGSCFPSILESRRSLPKKAALLFTAEGNAAKAYKDPVTAKWVTREGAESSNYSILTYPRDTLGSRNWAACMEAQYNRIRDASYKTVHISQNLEEFTLSQSAVLKIRKRVQDDYDNDMGKVMAFCMGGHSRLGSSSAASGLSTEILEIIIDLSCPRWTFYEKAGIWLK